MQVYEFQSQGHVLRDIFKMKADFGAILRREPRGGASQKAGRGEAPAPLLAQRLELLPSLLNVAQEPPLWPDRRITSAPGAE